MSDTLPYRRKEVIGGATLYLGDCREILPTLGKVDAVVTDAPYGIGWDYNSHDDTAKNWEVLISKLLTWCAVNARKTAVAIGSSIEREAFVYTNFPPKWRICHYKGSTGARCPIGFRNWEMVFVWGDGFGNGEKLPDYFQTPPAEYENYGHPCEKQIEWALWLVGRLSKADAVATDPFMGSGTTGVACAKLGRSFIGIEIDEGYFDIACDRIRKAYAQPDMFIAPPSSKPVQEPLI